MIKVYKHYEGYYQVNTAVWQMNEQQLLDQIDYLFNRDNLSDDYTLEELRLEALRQTEIDWRMPEWMQS